VLCNPPHPRSPPSSQSRGRRTARSRGSSGGDRSRSRSRRRSSGARSRKSGRSRRSGRRRSSSGSRSGGDGGGGGGGGGLGGELRVNTSGGDSGLPPMATPRERSRGGGDDTSRGAPNDSPVSTSSHRRRLPPTPQERRMHTLDDAFDDFLPPVGRAEDEDDVLSPASMGMAGHDGAQQPRSRSGRSRHSRGSSRRSRRCDGGGGGGGGGADVTPRTVGDGDMPHSARSREGDEDSEYNERRSGGGGGSRSRRQQRHSRLQATVEGHQDQVTNRRRSVLSKMGSSSRSVGQSGARGDGQSAIAEEGHGVDGEEAALDDMVHQDLSRDGLAAAMKNADGDAVDVMDPESAKANVQVLSEAADAIDAVVHTVAELATQRPGTRERKRVNQALSNVEDKVSDAVDESMASLSSALIQADMYSQKAGVACDNARAVRPVLVVLKSTSSAGDLPCFPLFPPSFVCPHVFSCVVFGVSLPFLTGRRKCSRCSQPSGGWGADDRRPGVSCGSVLQTAAGHRIRHARSTHS